MQGESTENAVRATTRVHAGALGLTAILLGLFIAVAGLYSVYGYRFVLFVYELQQVYRAEGYDGRGAAEQYEDYLRADPASLRMRGRLVDQLIQLEEYDRAVEAAEEAPASQSVHDRALVLLLVARAKLARGDVDASMEAYSEVLRLTAESGEAHFGLAQAYAARGEFSRMRDEFSAVQRNPSTASTTEFIKSIQASSASLGESAKTPADEFSDSARIARSLGLVQTARIDEAFDLLRIVRDFEGAPAAALFWRGVAEEAAGQVEAARGYYGQAAGAGHRLAKSAILRLDKRAGL